MKEKIYQIQQRESAQYGAAIVSIPPEVQKLVFAGNTLDDEALIADCKNLQKEATLHLTTRGRLQRPEHQPPVEAPAGASCGGVSGGDEHTLAASTTTIMRASLRLNPREHFPEFDGSDGWAVWWKAWTCRRRRNGTKLSSMKRWGGRNGVERETRSCTFSTGAPDELIDLMS